MAKELKSKEHMLHPFQKKASDTGYDLKMYQELSVLYSNYLKFLMNCKIKNKLLCSKMSETSSLIKGMSINDLLSNYESLDALIT